MKNILQIRHNHSNIGRLLRGVLLILTPYADRYKKRTAEPGVYLKFPSYRLLVESYTFNGVCQILPSVMSFWSSLHILSTELRPMATYMVSITPQRREFESSRSFSVRVTPSYDCFLITSDFDFQWYLWFSSFYGFRIKNTGIPISRISGKGWTITDGNTFPCFPNILIPEH